MLLNPQNYSSLIFRLPLSPLTVLLISPHLTYPSPKFQFVIVEDCSLHLNCHPPNISFVPLVAKFKVHIPHSLCLKFKTPPILNLIQHLTLLYFQVPLWSDFLLPWIYFNRFFTLSPIFLFQNLNFRSGYFSS